MSTTESLKALVGIATNKKLRGYLRHVYLITAQIVEDPPRCNTHGSCGCAHWKPSVRQLEALKFYAQDQKDLVDKKADRAYLIEAFTQLPALEGLTLVDSTGVLPNDVECHGMSKFIRLTGIRPNFAPSHDSDATVEYYQWMSHIWKAMMMAVASSGVTTIKTLKTGLRCHMHGLSPLEDLAFKQETLEKLSAAFAHLEIFDLQFRTTKLRPGKADTESRLDRAVKRIQAFAPVVRSATRFSLVFDFRDWAGSMYKAFLEQLDLAKMKGVALDSLATTGKILAGVISRMTSVEKLTLHAIDLNSGTWPFVLKTVEQLPNISHLHLQYLQQEGQKAFFLEQKEEEDGIDDILGANPPHADEDSDWEDSGDGSDDEPPPLIPQDDADEELDEQQSEAEQTEGEESEEQLQPTSDLVAEKAVDKCPHYSGKDHKMPGHESYPERGYYVCLPTRKEILDQIPQFIEEFNLGNNAVDDQLLNNVFGAALGGPNVGGLAIPIPIPAGAMGIPPVPGANQAAAGAQGGPNVGNIINALNTYMANPFGAPPNAPPPAAAQPAPAGNVQPTNNTVPAPAVPQATTGGGIPPPDQWMLDEDEDELYW